MISTVVLPILVILVLVLVNGVFVAAEFALVGARPSRLETLAEDGSRAARWLVSVVHRPTGKDGYIAVAQLGITLASIGLGMYGEPAVARWLYGPFETWGLSTAASHTAAFVIALSGITFMHVVFGEMIPKALALQAPENVSVRVNPVMRAFSVIFRPMVVVLNATAFALMRLLRIPEPDHRTSLYTSTELAIVTDEAADSGALGAMQRDLIRNVFDLVDRTVEEIMTPRGDIEALDLRMPAADIAQRIESSSRSRYPVIDGDLDHMVGVLHVKDFIRAEVRGAPTGLGQLIRPLPTVAATATAEQALERFRQERTHVCLVVDEYGGTLGLATMDDVIADVMDAEVGETGPPVIRRADGSLSAHGEVTLSELRDDFGVQVEHGQVTTIAGLVLAAHGTVPEVGTTIRVPGYVVVVDETLGRKITRVVITSTSGADGS